MPNPIPGDMASEDREEIIAAIAAALEDSAWGTATEDARHKTAKLAVARAEEALYRLGWMPPATTDRIFSQIRDWSARTATLPEHHINQSVLISQLTELTQILHGR